MEPKAQLSDVSGHRVVMFKFSDYFSSSNMLWSSGVEASMLIHSISTLDNRYAARLYTVCRLPVKRNPAATGGLAGEAASYLQRWLGC
jgi:hypothetical protein